MEAELSLINKVELRIALADTDAKFEASLKTYLAPLLLKLASPHQSVKNEVLKIIKHLTTRFSASPNVKMPLDTLLAQAKNPQLPQGQDPTLVQVYTLVMFSKGFERISNEAKAAFMPDLIIGISSVSRIVAARIFEALCKAIVAWVPPERGTDDAAQMRTFLKLDEVPADEQFLLEKFTQFMLLNPVLPRDGTIPRDVAFPGVSAADVTFFTYDAGVTFDSKTLLDYRKKMIPLLYYAFGKRAAVVLLVASADSTYHIAEAASAALKRLSVDYGHVDSVKQLVVLLSGDPSRGVTAVKPSLEEKILGYLEKTSLDIVGEFLPQILTIGLESDSLRVRRAAVSMIRKSSAMLTENSGTLLGYCDNLAAQLRDNLRLDSSTDKGSDYSANLTYKKHQIEALGLLLIHSSNEHLLDYIHFLFTALLSEEADLRLTIQDALSSLAHKANALSDDDKSRLTSSLEVYLRFSPADTSKKGLENYQSARYLAVKFINNMFPFDDAKARMMCVLAACSGNRPDTIEEAMHGLHPYWFNLMYNHAKEPLQFPTFNDMVTMLSQEKKSYFQGTSTLENCMDLAIGFVVKCLVMEAVSGKTTVIVTDDQWDTRLSSGLELDSTVIQLVVDKMIQLSSEADGDVAMDLNSLDTFLKLILDEFVLKTEEGDRVAVSFTNVSSSIKMFTRLLSLSPSTTCSKLVTELPTFLYAIFKNTFQSEDVVTAIGQSLGIIASCPEYSDSEAASLVQKLIATTSDSEVDIAVRAVGFLVSRLVARGRSNVLTPSMYDAVFGKVNDALTSSSNSLKNAAVDSISELAMYGVLGPQLVLSDHVNSFRENYKTSLEPLVKKLNEKAILAWSYLSLSEKEPKAEGSELSFYEKAVFDGHVSKQTEYMFTSGEALVVIAAGWDSTLMKRRVDIQGFTPMVDKKGARLEIILENVLMACSKTKPSLRRAGCIWLLSLVQYCGDFPVVSAHASEIHVAFMRFLADRDELVQESASRGLSIVYEMGDRELKDTLVHELLTSFTDSNKARMLSSGSVTGDTQLFDPGVLKTNDGSISTYKDILNLASEVGDPSLVYKFMSLAHNSALWSSRKGIAFGLGSILSKSKLTDLLGNNSKFANKLIPKLFRYRYDPSPTVQKSMGDIWTALVPNPSEVISSSFELILQELLMSMGNRDWRVRQSSTTALKDLLGYVTMDKYEPFLEKIWSMSFRAMDDIKESVRKEGQALARSLASTMVNFMSANRDNIDSEEKIHEALSKLIPLLLGPNGVQSEAEEVRNFGLKTLVSICSKFSSSLKPFIPTLTGEIISLMSTVEPQVINYLALNADKYNLTANSIDTQRTQLVGHSPMMEALEMMIGDLDETVLVSLVPNLQNSISKCVGLPSKIAGSRVLVSMVLKNPFIVKPYADSLLRLCMNQMKDRNDTVASSYAMAAAYWCRVASIDSIFKYSKLLNRLYFDSDIDRNREIAAQASEFVSKYSGDVFGSMSSAFLPLAFIAKHDPLPSVRDPFEREWSNTTGGVGAIKLYIQEITTIISENITSSNFHVRQVCAKSIAEAANKLDNTQSIGSSADILFSVLLLACQGRSWKGKEIVLDALVSLAIKFAKFIENDSEDKDLLTKINGVVVTEAKRRNKEYQKHSIKSFGRYLAVFPSAELVDEYTEIMETLLDDGYYDEDESEDEDMDRKKEDVSASRKNLHKEELKISFLANLVQAFSVDEDGDFSDKLFDISLKGISNLFKSRAIKTTWRTDLASSGNLITLLDRFKKFSTVNVSADQLSLLHETWLTITEECTREEATQNVTIQYVNSCGSLLEFLRKVGRGIEYENEVKAKLRELSGLSHNSVLDVRIKKALQS